MIPENKVALQPYTAALVAAPSSDILWTAEQVTWLIGPNSPWHNELHSSIAAAVFLAR
jgi:hypothetical protein